MNEFSNISEKKRKVEDDLAIPLIQKIMIKHTEREKNTKRRER